MKELGLYIHIPFCKSKCYYCDFNSVADSIYMVDDYVEYLKKEIDIYSELLKDKVIIKTMYFGGGTPSYIDGRKIYDILDHINKRFNLASSNEITIESNPKTLNENKLLIYKDIGINRISLGVQTLNDNLLRKIGRIHTTKDFLESYRLIRNTGFENVNLDIMFNLPGQTLEDVIDTLSNVISLEPEHISFYSLKLEEGTPFYRQYLDGKLDLPDEDLEREMYHRGIELLIKNQYIHYEISNFSKKGYESKHNLIYWQVKPYVGLGISAHSNINRERYSNFDSFEEYFKFIGLNKLPVKEREIIDTKTEMSEVTILGLRLIKGIKKKEFFNRFGVSIEEVFGSQLLDLQEKGLVKIDKEYVRLTKLGVDLSNRVFVELLP